MQGVFLLVAENHFTSPRALWWPESGTGPGCVTPTSLGGWASRGIARARSAPQLSRPLGAALPRGLPLRDHLLLEPSAPAHLSSGAKGGARTRSFPSCNSVALPRNWNPGFTHADSARSSHPPESGTGLSSQRLGQGSGVGDARAISEAQINEFQINQEPGVSGRTWARACCS